MKKILYIDMDGVLADFTQGLIDRGLEEGDGDKTDGIPNFFLDLPPMEGAVEAWHNLSTKFETYILSTPPWNNVSGWGDKRLWVERHLGESAKKRLILTHRKDLAIGDILVDDRLHNGAGAFKGIFVHFGQDGFNDWIAVRNFLEELK